MKIYKFNSYIYMKWKSSKLLLFDINEKYFSKNGNLETQRWGCDSREKVGVVLKVLSL